MHDLVGKNILLGVSGSIAAYKSAELTRRLMGAGAKVRVVMTASAKAFVTPLTFQTLTGHPVHHDMLSVNEEADITHINLARWADIILIAPATAHIIAQMAHGFASDLLCTLCLASDAQIVIAPAMNQRMWNNNLTQDNVKRLLANGVVQLGPDEGQQACGDTGPGRMLEAVDIVTRLMHLNTKRELAGINVLITAGPTQEYIDPVRYITNKSSGKMGYAMARAATELGATVTLVSGPVQLQAPPEAKRIDVTSAEEMMSQVLSAISTQDIFISTAAVADFKPAVTFSNKQKKSSLNTTLEMQTTEDILAKVSQLDRKPFVVGFAAETHDLEKKAKLKLKEKNLDMIAANLVGGKQGGFDRDDNALIVYWKNGFKELPLVDKQTLARQLMALISDQYTISTSGHSE